MDGLASFTGSLRSYGRGCRGSGGAGVVCPRWTGGFAGEEHGRRRRSEARGEMNMQERAKWREEELLKVLDQKRRVGEAHTSASHDGGEVAAGQSLGRGGAAWRAREKARGEELGRRPAWGRRVGAARAGAGTGRVAAAVSGGSLRRQGGGSVGRWSGEACSGNASRKGLRRWASSGATRGGQERQRGLGRPAAARLRSRGGAEEEERGGGARG
jgi:hypothetical protein